MAIYLPKGSIMKWNGNKITEHNRSEFQMSPERIKSSQRMANGTLREWVAATKWTFDASWDLVPADTARTVDGAWGGKAMESFFTSNIGPFTLVVTNGDLTTQTYTVVFKEFDKTIISRGGTTDAWNVSVSLEEV